MTVTGAIAYCLLFTYLAVERLLRKGTAALALKPGAADAGSSYFIWVASVITLVAVVLAPVLNHYGMGDWYSQFTGWTGVVWMLGGLVVRYLAATTLGMFYTRTLQVGETQHIVDAGLYSVIRHPGYLGTLLISTGAGLAVNNWIVLGVVLITGIGSKLYRIRVEEAMLHREFAEEYASYVQKTWKLIPFVW